MISSAQWFGDTGRLHAIIDGFQSRPQQQHMADAISEQLQQGEHLVCEAGTGTGKTLAYLLPTLNLVEKIVVSTATKTLQKQLFSKDIPVASKALSGGINAFLLKGKQNYLSLRRLQQTTMNVAQLSGNMRQQLAIINRWAQTTQTGDRAECQGIADNAAIWHMVCNRSQDENSADDFYSQARNKAKQAELLIINHHLLCAELASLSKHGFTLLRDFPCMVIDEAHHLANIATHMFSEKLSSFQLHETLNECNQSLFFLPEQQRQSFLPAVNALSACIHRLQFTPTQPTPQRQLWAKVVNAEVSQRIEHCFAANNELLQQFQQLHEHDSNKSSINLLQSNADFLQRLLNSEQTDEVAWLETLQNNHYNIYLTPLAVAQQLQEYRQLLGSHWIFTSATLSIANQFKHFLQSQGLAEETPTLQLDSPFDYAKQAIWYQPQAQPDSSSLQQFLQHASDVCRLTNGRAFLLFCSYRSLHYAQDYLQQLSQQFTLLCQGDATNAQLLQRFTEQDNAILLGTTSFWEGVDVRGDALQFVGIEKLPFANPAEPLIQARQQWYQRQQKNYFSEESIPRAVISLKQGLGRLIRDVKDTGIILIGDQRLFNKPYGKVFLASLPNYRIAKDLQQLQSDWHSMHNRD